MNYKILLLVLERCCRVIVTLLSTKIVAKELGVLEFSEYLTYLNAVQLISIFSLFGMREPILKNLERYNRSFLHAFDCLFYVYFLLMFIGLLIYSTSGWTLGLVLCAFLAFFEFYYLVIAYNGLNVRILSKLLGVPIAGVAIRYILSHYLDIGVAHFVCIYVIEGGILVLMTRHAANFAFFKKLHFGKALTVILHTFKINYHLLLAGLSVVLYTRLEFWFATLLNSSVESVEIGIGLRIAEMTAIIPASIALGLSKILYTGAFKNEHITLFILGSLCAVAIYFSAPILVGLLYGDKYLFATHTVRIYSLSVPFIWIGSIMEKRFFKEHGPGFILSVLSLALALSFILNLFNLLLFDNSFRPYIYVFVQSFACLWGYFVVTKTFRHFSN